ncbi:MAG: PPK2 family polyphosphate kinase [Beutenbergiaceae bacterium]
MGTTTKSAAAASWDAPASQLLQVTTGFDLAAFDRGSTPGWSAGKSAAKEHMKARGKELSELQERLFADGKSGGTRSILLLLQGMDTAGKGGIVRHVIGMVDPQGVALASFGVPTEQEKEHHHLWRIERKLPAPGKIGVFDRSHYEQVLVVKVDELEPPELNATRYQELIDFDRGVADGGTTIIKVALLVSHAEQGTRLADRLDRPDKWWKYNPGDIDVRQNWNAYQDAYAQMLARTSVTHAPWYAVPADNKWYARLAVTELLFEALTAMKLGWPPADFDVEIEKQRLAATAS